MYVYIYIYIVLKVAVLVGGPDWPVSVTCGILKVKLLQMLIGTCPVIVVLTPCVLAGAFLARVQPGEESIWSLLAAGAMGLSVFGQMTSMAVAVFCVTRVIEKYGEELKQTRPEHQAVEALTLKEKDYVEKYKEVTRWSNIGLLKKALILSSVTIIHLSLYIYIYIYICVHVHTCMCICIYIYIYIHLSLYAYIYIYMCTHTFV